MTDLVSAKYVSFATFRKSGVQVATPVWCAEADGSYYIFSAADSGKVKRLRNSSRAQLAVCDLRGKLLGSWYDADAELIDNEPEVKQALAALRQK